MEWGLGVCEARRWFRGLGFRSLAGVWICNAASAAVFAASAVGFGLGFSGLDVQVGLCVCNAASAAEARGAQRGRRVRV